MSDFVEIEKDASRFYFWKYGMLSALR